MIDAGPGFDVRAEFLSRPEQLGEIERAENRGRHFCRPLPLLP